MPVKEIKVNEDQANYVNLDYDGIRLVYPNTTFGPGFGHRLEPKSEVEDAFAGIESMPYSLFQGITREERIKLMEYVRPFPDEFIDPNTLSMETNVSLDHVVDIPAHRKKLEAKSSVYSEIDIITKSNKLLAQQIKSYQYIHEKLFANNPQANERLQKAMDSVLKELESRYPQSVAEVILAQFDITPTDAKKGFSRILKIVFDSVDEFMTMIGVYLKELRDSELLSYFENVIEPFRADMKDITNNTIQNIYKNVCIQMHCLNIFKVIFDKLSRKYRHCIVLLDSQISAIFTFLKHIYLFNLSIASVPEEYSQKAMYHIIMNIQMMFYYIKYRDGQDNMVNMYNQQNEINDLKSQIMIYRDFIKVADEEAKKNTEAKIVLLQQRIHKLEELIRNSGPITDRVKLYFWPQDRFSAKLADIFMFVYTVAEKRPILNKPFDGALKPLGGHLIDNTSNHLRFDNECRVAEDIEKNYDDLLGNYLYILYSNFDRFVYDAVLLFRKEPEANQKVLEKYNVFNLSLKRNDKFPLVPIFKENRDRMIQFFKREAHEIMNHIKKIHQGDFLLVATNEIETTKWNSFIIDIESWFSADVVNELKAIYTKRFNIANMILYCLKPFEYVSFYDRFTKKRLENCHYTDMYMIRLTNIQVGIEIEDFMDDLFHYIRFVSKNIRREASTVHKDEVYDITNMNMTSIHNLDIDEILNSIHLIDYYESPSSLWRGNQETRIVLGINNRHIVFQFMYIMFKHDFNHYAIKRFPNPVRTTTYVLHHLRPNTNPRARNARPPPNNDPEIFFIKNEIPNPNSIQIDLLTNQWKKEGRIQRLRARTYDTTKVSYHVYKALEGILKSCAIYSTNFYLVPKWDNQAKKLVYIKKYDQKNMRKTENLVHFYSNVAKSLLWYMSQNVHSKDFPDNEHAMTSFNYVLSTIIELVKDTKNDFMDLDSYAKTPERVNDSIADACYLGMCYNFDKTFQDYMFDIINLKGITAVHRNKLKIILRVFREKEEIEQWHKNPTEFESIEEFKNYRFVPNGNVLFSSNEEYYNDCVLSFKEE